MAAMQKSYKRNIGRGLGALALVAGALAMVVSGCGPKDSGDKPIIQVKDTGEWKMVGGKAVMLDFESPDPGVEWRAMTVRGIRGELTTVAIDLSEVQSTMRALTLDDGRSAVTPNYLKVTLDRQLARNEWTRLRIDDMAATRAVVLPPVA